MSYLEIYNEKVNDLLSKKTDLKVHEDVNGQVFVKCKEEVTNSPENILSLMSKGNKNRRIGETNMNERSSRSHTIFRIVSYFLSNLIYEVFGNCQTKQLICIISSKNFIKIACCRQLRVEKLMLVRMVQYKYRN